MRVAVDATPLAGPRSGIGHFTNEVLSALATHEPQIDVLPYVLSGRAFVDRMRRNGHERGPGRHLPVPAGLAVRWWSEHDSPRFDRILGHADVVHGTNFVVPPMRRAARVVSVHDLTFIRRPELCRPEVLAVVPLVRRALTNGAWAHTLTEAVAAEVREEFRTDRVVAVHPAVPRLDAPAQAQPSAHIEPVLDAGPYALALGAAEPRKNLLALVNGFPRDSRLRLVIAGPPGPDSPALATAAAAHGAVTVLGYVSDAERTVLVRNARVLVHAAIDEGFGFPVVEAMTAGVPVVCTRTAVLEEVAGDAAEFVVDGWEDAAEQILATAFDDARRGTLIGAGTARAARYSWAATAHGLADLYGRAAAAS